MSETSHEDEHHDERLSPKTPDEHSGNQDAQGLSHRRQEAEGKLQERQEKERREQSDRDDESGRED